MSRRIALVGAVLALAFAGAGASPAGSTTSLSPGVSCAASVNEGYGVAAEYVAHGYPAFVVRGMCRALRNAGWQAGLAHANTHLICAGRMRSFPHVEAGIFATPAAAGTTRRQCAGMFPRSTWIRFIK